jgi:hypothetical protein
VSACAVRAVAAVAPLRRRDAPQAQGALDGAGGGGGVDGHSDEVVAGPVGPLAIAEAEAGDDQGLDAEDGEERVVVEHVHRGVVADAVAVRGGEKSPV